MRQSRRRPVLQVQRASAACGKCCAHDLPSQNYTFQGTSARNARARLNIGVNLASIQKYEGRSTLTQHPLIIAGPRASAAAEVPRRLAVESSWNALTDAGKLTRTQH